MLLTTAGVGVVDFVRSTPAAAAFPETVNPFSLAVSPLVPLLALEMIVGGVGLVARRPRMT